VVEKLNHNRSHTAEQQLIKGLAVGSDDRAEGSGDSEGAAQSGGDQPGTNGGGEKGKEEVDQPWERPPTFQVSFMDAFPYQCYERTRTQKGRSTVKIAKPYSQSLASTTEFDSHFNPRPPESCTTKADLVSGIVLTFLHAGLTARFARSEPQLECNPATYSPKMLKWTRVARRSGSAPCARGFLLRSIPSRNVRLYYTAFSFYLFCSFFFHKTKIGHVSPAGVVPILTRAGRVPSPRPPGFPAPEDRPPRGGPFLPGLPKHPRRGAELLRPSPSY
jgi:hypothetical protein